MEDNVIYCSFRKPEPEDVNADVAAIIRYETAVAQYFGQRGNAYYEDEWTDRARSIVANGGTIGDWPAYDEQPDYEIELPRYRIRSADESPFA